MSKTKILIIIFSIILVAGAFIFFKFFSHKSALTIFHQQSTSENNANLSPPSVNDLQNDSNTDESTSGPSDNQSSDNMSSGGQPSSTDSTLDKKAPSGSMLAHITPQHCDDNCQAFVIDLSLFEYCQQVCGISPVKKVTNCDDKKDIQKDYCLKDLAIGKKDASMCDKIKDANIEEACTVIIEENDLKESREETGSQRENPSF